MNNPLSGPAQGQNEDPSKPLLEPLTRREQEILELLAEGLTSSEMAERLTLAVSSVRWYVQQIYAKLGVNGKRQAITRASQLGLLQPGAAIPVPDLPATRPEQSLPSGIVTFLFTDIEGSTPLWERMPAAMREAVAQHHDLLRQAIEGNHGQVNQVIGDSFQAAFRLAANGLSAALAAQRALRDNPWGQTGPLNVRMGLHIGPAELDPQGNAPYTVSHTLNRASRIMSAAHGGQVLLSQETADLVQRELPPGVRLRDLGEHHLKGMQQPEHLYQVVASDLPKDFPPLANAITHLHNLPIQRTSFIGRQVQVIQVKDLLKQHALVTLTGSGGVGKTRLSLQVAQELVEQFADGVWLVALAPVTDPALVTQTVASVLGLRTAGSQPIHEILLDYLRDKQVLLVLDNCEHLIEACATLVDELLQTCPHLKILASSREALGVVGEMPFRVPSMSLPGSSRPPELAEMEQFEAVRLFSERARAAQPDFQVTARNALAVAQICQRLDGIPLALELAAARLNVLTTEQLTQHLDDAFRLLTGGVRTALPRQQTLRAAIDWSFRLLSPQEQSLLRRLSVFTGSFDLAAVQAVCCLEAAEQLEPLDLLASLVNKSMLLAELQPDQEMRYHLLETIRQYAREKLNDAGESLRLHELHARYFLDLVKQDGPNDFTRQTPAWLRRVDIDFPNIHAALMWALEGRAPEQAIATLLAMGWYWTMRGIHEEGRALLEKALTCVDAEHPSLARAGLLRDLGLLGMLLDTSSKKDHEFLIVSREMFRELGDRNGYAISSSWLGFFDVSEADYIDKNSAIFKDLGDDESQALVLELVGTMTRDAADPDLDKSEFLLKESARLYRKMGARWRLGKVYEDLGYNYFLKGQPEQARSLVTQALPLLHEVGDQWGLMLIKFWQGWMEAEGAVDDASLDNAEVILLECLETARKFGNKFWFVINIPLLLARVAQKRGEYSQAIARIRETLRLLKGFGTSYQKDNFSWTGQYLLGLAEAAVSLDNVVYSATLLETLDGLGERENFVLRDIKSENVKRIYNMTAPDWLRQNSRRPGQKADC